MVDEVIIDFPKTLSDIYSTLIDWNRPLRKKINVVSENDTWLIKVWTKRCRLDGHVITPRYPECDPCWEGMEYDCGD